MTDLVKVRKYVSILEETVHDGGAALAKPVTKAVVGGVVANTEDGSIDELLWKKRGCSPVITAELILRSETTPPLSERVSTYLKVLDAFFGP